MIPHIDRIRSEVRRLHLLNSKNVDMDLAIWQAEGACQPAASSPGAS